MIVIRPGVVLLERDGVMISKAALVLQPSELKEAIETGLELLDDPDIQYAAGGGESLLTECLHKYISIRDFYHIKAMMGDDDDQTLLGNSPLERRRARFNSKRDRFFVKLIDSGIPYQCATSGCDAKNQLTIDHKKPLSRGGSDELSNLQFLCRSCNARKFNKVVPS